MCKISSLKKRNESVLKFRVTQWINSLFRWTLKIGRTREFQDPGKKTARKSDSLTTARESVTLRFRLVWILLPALSAFHDVLSRRQQNGVVNIRILKKSSTVQQSFLKRKKKNRIAIAKNWFKFDEFSWISLKFHAARCIFIQTFDNFLSILEHVLLSHK